MLETSKLKTLLGLKDDEAEQDIRLAFILEDVQETICNYCNIRQVPKGLENTAYRMAMDLYRNESIGNEERDGNITSIKEGDTTVNMSMSYDNVFASSVLKRYESQLNCYRKLRW